MSKDEEIEYYDNLLKIIENVFTENYDTLILDNSEDEYIETSKMAVTFTTSDNQRNNINNNKSIIDIGECEILLRNYYNISNNEKLYIKKIDMVQEGMTTTKVEYDVYCKLYGTNLIKLNLTICKNSKILIFMPFNLDGNIDEYNSSSGYYNDICYTVTSEDGADISVKDRQREYINKNKIVCQEDCIFSNYDIENSKAQCSCDTKESSSSVADMTIDKAKLVLDNFIDIKNFVNIDFLICYKKLLNKEGIIKNIGSYFLLVIIFFHIITIFIFYISQFSSIKTKIKEIIIFGIFEFKLFYDNRNMKKEKIKRRINNYKNTYKKEINNRKKMFIKKISLKFPKKLLGKKNKYKKYKKSKTRSVCIDDNTNKREISYNNVETNKKFKIYDNREKTNSNIDLNCEDKIKKIKDIMKYTDDEINSLPYNLAIQFDKRTYCNYYISLLKTKHNLIFSLSNSDYNSRIVKIDLFFIGFTIEYVVNAFFYNDDTMHNIYERKGEYNLEDQLPIIVYSYIISMILNTPLNILALSNDEIINFKQNKSQINKMKRAKYLTNRLTIKFILYFIISFLLLLFFWYYISMFCAIYRNTQLHLLKDTLMSFGLSLIIPLGFYLFPGLFRIPALSNRKNKRLCLYNFSRALQFF